jgi:hypothetical protein
MADNKMLSVVYGFPVRASSWNVVPARRPDTIGVYKEVATGIHYVIKQNDLESGTDDVIVRAVVELRPNFFVFTKGEGFAKHYSAIGLLPNRSNFSSMYVFVRTLDRRKIQTVSFSENDSRLVSYTYRANYTFEVQVKS